MITKPSLPPKAGYVEVEVCGIRTYRNSSTGALIEEELAAQMQSDSMEQLRADVDFIAVMTGVEL